MLHRSFILVLLTVLSTAATAQFNDKGTIHLSVGGAFGGHATEYTSTVTLAGFTNTTRSSDNAATHTFPIQFQYGLTSFFSLGIYAEPGTYLDSNATRSNGVFLGGLEPRFYIVNKDHFAWMASLQLGTIALGIDDSENGVGSEARFWGQHFGLSSGVAIRLSDLVNLQLSSRWLGTRMDLTSLSVNGTAIGSENYTAELTTRGVFVQVSIGFRF